LHLTEIHGVGTAANVIAVIGMTVNVTTILFQYSTVVKNVRTYIKRLIGVVEGLQASLEGSQKLLETPNGARLKTTHSVWGKLDDCYAQLVAIKSEVPSKMHKETKSGASRLMSRFDISALKWPF
jgi:hypothetical protein